jgi:TolB protein
MRRAQTQELRFGLHVVDIQSGRSQTLLEFEPPALFVNQFLPFFDQYAKSHRIWSPDSQALVVPIITGERVEVCVVPIQGEPLRSVAEGLMATWSW